jgi:hypothetical protein
MLFEMKRWLAVALLAAGCYRSSPPPTPPPAPPAASQRPRSEEPGASFPRHHAPRAALRGEQDLVTTVMARFVEFTDDMCACTDPACVHGVEQEIALWSRELEPVTRDVQPTDQQMEEMKRNMERLAKCMTTAMSVATPPSLPAP